MKPFDENETWNKFVAIIHFETGTGVIGFTTREQAMQCATLQEKKGHTCFVAQITDVLS